MHLMIDFETLGTGADSIVVSMGAVGFNKAGIICEKLFEFDLLDQQILGRSFTASTLKWFMKQSDQARAVFNSENKKLKIAEFFGEFERFCLDGLQSQNERFDELKPWGNGANFDISILEDMYRRHHTLRDEGIPWKFWNVTCFRTFNLLTKCKDMHKRPQGTHHSALDDARYQANCVLAFYKVQQIKKAQK